MRSYVPGARCGSAPPRHQGVEGALVHPLLGVPLHAEDEAGGRQLDRLDDTVVGAPPWGPARAQVRIAWWCEHSTVVVSPKTVGGAEPGTVSTSTSPNTKGALRCSSCAHDVGQVLVQRAAQLDVEDLAAAADGEHRHVGLQRGGQQGPLAGVADGSTPPTSGPGSRRRRRVDVAPAGQHQAVEGTR
jgi:hypothetical protein